jgi:hypothetical protein
MNRKNWQLSFFRREQRSLFGEILDWMLTPLLLLWPVSLALTWLVAQGLANKPFDRALVYNVQALAQLVKLSPDQQSFQFNLPQPASELLRADDAKTNCWVVIEICLSRKKKKNWAVSKSKFATMKCADLKCVWPTPGFN